MKNINSNNDIESSLLKGDDNQNRNHIDNENYYNENEELSIKQNNNLIEDNYQYKNSDISLIEPDTIKPPDNYKNYSLIKDDIIEANSYNEDQHPSCNINDDRYTNSLISSIEPNRIEKYNHSIRESSFEANNSIHMENSNSNYLNPSNQPDRMNTNTTNNLNDYHFDENLALINDVNPNFLNNDGFGSYKFNVKSPEQIQSNNMVLCQNSPIVHNFRGKFNENRFEYQNENKIETSKVKEMSNMYTKDTHIYKNNFRNEQCENFQSEISFSDAKLDQINNVQYKPKLYISNKVIQATGDITIKTAYQENIDSCRGLKNTSLLESGYDNNNYIQQSNSKSFPSPSNYGEYNKVSSKNYQVRNNTSLFTHHINDISRATERGNKQFNASYPLSMNSKPNIPDNTDTMQKCQHSRNDTSSYRSPYRAMLREDENINNDAPTNSEYFVNTNNLNGEFNPLSNYSTKSNAAHRYTNNNSTNKDSIHKDSNSNQVSTVNTSYNHSSEHLNRGGHNHNYTNNTDYAYNRNTTNNTYSKDIDAGDSPSKKIKIDAYGFRNNIRLNGLFKI